MGLFKSVFHTKGCFVKDPKVRYEGGDIYEFNRQYFDFWSFFEARDLIKGIDSAFNVVDVKIQWKNEEGCLENDLRPFRNNEDAYLLTLFAKKNNFDVERYTQPKLSTCELTYIERLIENQKEHKSVENSVEESESSYESMNGIHFKDNEEERMHGFDEDFDEGFNFRVDEGEPKRENVNGVATS